MRVLFTPYSARSHVYSLVSVAWALQSAGHDVRVSCHPDEVEWVTSAGLTAVPVGRELDIAALMQTPEVLAGIRHDIAEDRPEKLTWEYVHGVWEWYTSALFRNVTDDATMDDLVGFARSWQPDLVIWDPLNFSGPVAARATGAAHARMLFGLDFGVRMRRIFLDLHQARPDGERSDPLAEWLSGVLDRHGCSFDEEIVTGQWTIDPMPSRLRLPEDVTYVPVRYVPFNGPATLPEWVHKGDGRPRVCFTLGLSGRELFGGDGVAIADMLTALADLDVEVVATLDSRQLDSVTVPDNVRLIDFLPLQALLPTCSAVVHHGGATTCGTAVLAGVPQLVIYTKVWDKAAVAYDVADRGAGLAVDVDVVTAGDVRDGVRRLLTEPSFTQGADRIRQDALAAPGPAEIVPSLVELTARHTRRSGK